MDDSSRERQIRRDRYYMGIARAVRGRRDDNERREQGDQAGATLGGANCLGSRIGAVLVRDDRIIGTGYNGTPSGMQNCDEGGCVRCSDRLLEKQGRQDAMSDRAHIAGQALDRCVCVHAEQNALLTAARFGISVESSTLYTTLSPCFTCLKEAVQAGIERIVYDETYEAHYSKPVQDQYELLSSALKDKPGGAGDTAFEPLAGETRQASTMPPPDPVETST